MNTMNEHSVMPPTSNISTKDRICPRCGKSSNFVPFYVRKNGRLSDHCKECEKYLKKELYLSYKLKLMSAKGSLCKCGCGELTKIAIRSNKRWGIKAGEPLNYINRHARRLSPFEYLEEDRGYKTPCWIWQRSKDRDGYGFTSPNTKGGSHRSHVVYYEKKYGPIPLGLVPDHLCRVPSCVNPDHLEIVTVADNTRRGKSAKLTGSDVDSIRLMLEKGITQDRIAKVFGVTQTMVSRIKLGKCWREN